MIRKISLVFFFFFATLLLSVVFFLIYEQSVQQNSFQSFRSPREVALQNYSQGKIEDLFSGDFQELTFYEIRNTENNSIYWSTKAPQRGVNGDFLEVFKVQKNKEGVIASRVIGLGSGDGVSNFDYQFDEEGDLKSMTRYLGYIAGTGSFSGEVIYEFIEKDSQIKEFHYWSGDEATTEIYVNDKKIGTGRVSSDIIEQYGVENIIQIVKISEEESAQFEAGTIESINGKLSEKMVILSVDELIEHLGTVKYY